MLRPNIQVVQYSIQILVLFILFSVCRALFWMLNGSYFSNISVVDFIVGLRFDAISIALIFLPFHLFTLIALWYENKAVQNIRFFFLLFGTGLSILLNAVDFEYFKFTHKRTTTDVFALLSYGNDAQSLIPQFLMDYWYIAFLAALLFYGTYRLLKSTRSINSENFSFKTLTTTKRIVNQSIYTLLIIGLFVLAGRGGTQLIPLKIIDAARLTEPQNVPLILNTPFTLIRTLGKSSLKTYQYYTEKEANNIFDPIHPGADHQNFKSNNVVVIVLESFSMEFIQSKNRNYLTPFFNQLKNKGLFFDHCYSNGKKSIEGIPSILSALPTLMDNPLISGPYAGNNMKSIADYLRTFNYHTSFFHGGRNGTMNFNSYARAVGFEHYYGLNEYPNINDFDGTWGIYDEPFFNFFTKQLNTFPEPFFSTFFSLSSHHPYAIPAQHQSTFNQSNQPMDNAIAYADYSLQQFFEFAEKQPWFKHTLFVITADHTPDGHNEYYMNTAGMYRIPLLFYAPSDTELVGTVSKNTQQTDILPSILDYLNYPNDYFAYGNSVFDHSSGFSFQYINGIHQLIENDVLFQWRDGEPVALFDLRKDSLLQNNVLSSSEVLSKKMNAKIKALVQQYNGKIVSNQITE